MKLEALIAKMTVFVVKLRDFSRIGNSVAKLFDFSAKMVNLVAKLVAFAAKMVNLVAKLALLLPNWQIL